MRKVAAFALLLGFVSLVSCFINSCGSSQGGSGSSPAGNMPRLDSGRHLGMIVGFEAYPSGTQTVVDQMWNQALTAGMKIGRVQVDWSALETAPGVYDQSDLTDGLEALEADGLQPFVTLCTVDSEGLELPADLLNSTTGRLADDMSLDNEVVIARLRSLLDWMVPIISQYGGWGLSIANEPACYMEDLGGDSSDLVAFLTAARDHVRTLDSRLAVTMTMTFGEIQAGADYLPAIISKCDVACFNYYGLNPDLTILDCMADVSTHFDQMISTASGKEVIIQELGCPAGFDNGTSYIGTSPEQQRAFFEEAFTALRTKPKVRAAFVFQLVDWSQSLTSLFGQILRDEGVEDSFVRRFEEWLMTIGFCTYDDGTQRPSWDEFLECLDALYD